MNACDGVIIEPARAPDAQACGAVMSDWINETGWMPRIHSRSEDRRHLDDLITRGWVTVARRCGQPVGFLARDGAEVHALYLTRASRGQGIGKALLDRAKHEQDRLTLFTFQANTRAQAFYLREGFSEIDRSDGAANDEKLPDVRFAWKRGSA